MMSASSSPVVVCRAHMSPVRTPTVDMMARGLDEEWKRILEGLERMQLPIWPIGDDFEVEPRFEEKPQRKQRQKKNKKPQQQSSRQAGPPPSQAASPLPTVSPTGTKKVAAQEQISSMTVQQQSGSPSTPTVDPDNSFSRELMIKDGRGGGMPSKNAAGLWTTPASSASLSSLSSSGTVSATVTVQASLAHEAKYEGKGGSMALGVIKNMNVVAAMTSSPSPSSLSPPPAHAVFPNPSRPLISRGRSAVCIQVERIQVFTRTNGSLCVGGCGGSSGATALFSSVVAALPNRALHREHAFAASASPSSLSPGEPPSGALTSGLGQQHQHLYLPFYASSASSTSAYVAAGQQHPPPSPSGLESLNELAVGCSSISEELSLLPSLSSMVAPSPSPLSSVRRGEASAAPGTPHGSTQNASGQIVSVPPPPLFGMHQDKKRSAGKSKFKPPLNRGWKVLTAAFGLGFLKDNNNQGGGSNNHHHHHPQHQVQHQNGGNNNWFHGSGGGNSHHHYTQQQQQHGGFLHGQFPQQGSHIFSIVSGNNNNNHKEAQRQLSYAPASAPARSSSPLNGRHRHHHHHQCHNYFTQPAQSRLFHHQHGYSSSGGPTSPLSRSQELPVTSSDNMLGWSDIEDGDWTPRSFGEESERQLLRNPLAYRRLEATSDEGAEAPGVSGRGGAAAAASSTPRKRSGGGGATSAAVDVEKRGRISPIKRRLQGHPQRRHNFAMDLTGTEGGGGSGGDAIGVGEVVVGGEGYPRGPWLLSKGGPSSSPPTTSGTPRHLVVSHGRTSSSYPFFASSDVDGDESSSGASGCASPGISRCFSVIEDDADQIPWLPCFSEKRQKIQAVHFLIKPPPPPPDDDLRNRKLLSDQIAGQSNKNSKVWREQWRPCSPYPKEAKGRFPGSYLFEDDDDDDSFVSSNGERLGTNSGLLGVKLRVAREAEKKVPKREERKSGDDPAETAPTQQSPEVAEQPRPSSALPDSSLHGSAGLPSSSSAPADSSHFVLLEGVECHQANNDDRDDTEKLGMQAVVPRPSDSSAGGDHQSCAPISLEGESVDAPSHSPLSSSHVRVLDPAFYGVLGRGGGAQEGGVVTTSPLLATAWVCCDAASGGDGQEDVGPVGPDDENPLLTSRQETGAAVEAGRDDEGTHGATSEIPAVPLRPSAAGSVAERSLEVVRREGGGAGGAVVDAEGVSAESLSLSGKCLTEGSSGISSNVAEEKTMAVESMSSSPSPSSFSTAVTVSAFSMFVGLTEKRSIPSSVVLTEEEAEGLMTTVGGVHKGRTASLGGAHRVAVGDDGEEECNLRPSSLLQKQQAEVGIAVGCKQEDQHVVADVMPGSVEGEVGSLRHWFPSFDVPMFDEDRRKEAMMSKVDEERRARLRASLPGVMGSGVAVEGGDLLLEGNSDEGEKSRKRAAVVSLSGENARTEGRCHNHQTATHQHDCDEGGAVIGASGYLDDDEREDGDAAGVEDTAGGSNKDRLLSNGWEEVGVLISVAASEESDRGRREKRWNAHDGSGESKSRRSKDFPEGGRKCGGDNGVLGAGSSSGRRRGRSGRTLEQLALPSSSSGGFYDDVTTSEGDAAEAFWKGGRALSRRKEPIMMRERRDCLRWSNPLFNTLELSPPPTPTTRNKLGSTAVGGVGVGIGVETNSVVAGCVSEQQRRPNLRYSEVDLLRSSAETEDAQDLCASDTSENNFLDVVDNIDDDVPPVLVGEESLLDTEHSRRTRSMWKGWPDCRELESRSAGSLGKVDGCSRRVEMEMEEEEEVKELDMDIDEEEDSSLKVVGQQAVEDRNPALVTSDRWFGRESASLFLASRRTRNQSAREVLPAGWRLPPSENNSSSIGSSRRATAFSRHIPSELVEPLTITGPAFRGVNVKKEPNGMTRQTQREKDMAVAASSAKASDIAINPRSCRTSSSTVPRPAGGHHRLLSSSAHFQCSFGSDCPESAHGHWYLDNISS